MPIVLMRMKEVLHRVTLSKSEVYRRIKAGSFPRQVRLGPSRIAFREDEISEWIRTRPLTSPNKSWHAEGGANE